MKLPFVNLLLLNEYDGKPTDYQLGSMAKLQLYGREYKHRLEKLMAEGYLTYGTSEDSLNRLTIPALKEILRRNNQKLSGKKDELIARIVKNIPVEKYVDNLSKIYVATEKGRVELSERYQYIENQQMQYGFLNSEIEEMENKLSAEKKFTADAVLEQLFLRDITKHGKMQNFGILRNTYYNLSLYFKRRDRMEESLRSLLTVIYYDLSGAGNNGIIEPYENINYAFETSLWSDIDKIRAALDFTDEDLKKLFDEAVDISVKVPFLYFDTSTMKEIILDRLRGETDLLQKYENVSQSLPKKDISYGFILPEDQPKKKYKIWLSVAVLFLFFVLTAFLINESSTVSNSPIVQKELTAEEKANQEKWRVTIEGTNKLQRENSNAVAVTNDTMQKNDVLQNMFAKISVNTTEQELQSYIVTDNLEYTNQSDAPKQTTYKIAYIKDDTLHTRSTGGDYIAVTFDTRSKKLISTTYFNSHSSIELLMTSGVLHGHKSDGRTSGYYYLNEINSYKGLDNAEECYSAQDALNRMKMKLSM